MCVSLVRALERDSVRHLRAHTDVLDLQVLFARSFRPIVDRVAMEDYAARLSLVARYANEGTFGCFAQTQSAAGSVEVILYERWFDGGEVHTDELARRAFDASHEESLVASVEFLADVRIWAERRNQEREETYLRERAAGDARSLLASQREAAGRELHEILAAHTRAG